MMQHKLPLELASAIFLSIAASTVFANAGGISSHDGYNNPLDAENTCAAATCHSGGSFTGTAAWTGSQSLAPAGFANYTYKVNSSNASGNGVSLSARSSGGTRSG